MEMIFLILIIGVALFILINTLVIFTGAPYAPTPQKDIKKLLKELKLDKFDTVYDLGSGDGQLLIEISKLGVKSVGFEINPYLYLLTKFRLKKVPQASVYLANFWTQDFKRATVLFAFILPQFMSKLEKKIVPKLKPGTKVITYLAYLPHHTPIKQINGFNIYQF